MDKGQYIEWDSEHNCFYILPVHKKSATLPGKVGNFFFPEDFLRKVFRDCIKGLGYCI